MGNNRETNDTTTLTVSLSYWRQDTAILGGSNRHVNDDVTK